MPNTIEVVSSNPAHGEMYSIQPYVIKFVSDLRQVSGFLRVILVSSTKNDWPSRYNWNIVEHNNNNPLDKLYIDSPSVTRGLQYFSTLES